MDTLSRGFWKLPHCSKLGILREDRHRHIILSALWDADTGIEETEPSVFTLYGPDDGLLVQSNTAALRLAMVLCEAAQTFQKKAKLLV